MAGGTPGEKGLHLLDISALVVGYGLGSMLIRAYWPDSGTPDAGPLTVIIGVFLWLGLAMSGPLVLLIRRPPLNSGGVGPDVDAEPAPRTWAEHAWLIIGFYWIGLTILVVPTRAHGSRFLDSAVLGIFPVLAALGLRIFGPRPRGRADGERAWTHRAGVALLVSWPFAWVGLILLGKSL